MADVQRHEQVATTDGQNQSGVSQTTQTTADPVSGAQLQQTTTRMWAGRAPGIEIVWLITGIVVTFLAGDFFFHATGANNVGFAAFVFSVGSFFAAPFAGIFTTTTAAPGNLVIWADVLAIVVYLIVAGGVVKVVAMAAARNSHTTAV